MPISLNENTNPCNDCLDIASFQSATGNTYPNESSILKISAHSPSDLPTQCVLAYARVI